MESCKKELDRDLVVLGSRKLVQALMRHNLVDVFVLLIHPLILGAGSHLFTDDSVFAALRLVDIKTTPTGVVIATYQSAEKGFGHVRPCICKNSSHKHCHHG